MLRSRMLLKMEELNTKLRAVGAEELMSLWGLECNTPSDGSW